MGHSVSTLRTSGLPRIQITLPQSHEDGSARDPRMAELRSTLRRYLDTNRSPAKVAAMEQISRNTVTYRVQQAFTLCAHSGDVPTDKLRAALTVAEWLLDSPHTDQ
jgi:hypothetical protein